MLTYLHVFITQKLKEDLLDLRHQLGFVKQEVIPKNGHLCVE
jgi:hypothetical protein